MESMTNKERKEIMDELCEQSYRIAMGERPCKRAVNPKHKDRRIMKR